jgi:nucleoside-diphosphate-sugar epimerase
MAAGAACTTSPKPTGPTCPARHLTPYIQSKTVPNAPRATGWRAKAGLEFCSICPSVVLGPVWSRDYSASVAVVQKLLDGSLRACPDIGFGVVDVRDVADLHVRALTRRAWRASVSSPRAAS